MSNINKQELREAAERAESDSWGYDRDEFNEALTPSTVLALLDELEAKDSMIAAQQHEIRTLLNALEGRPCPKCNDTGMADSGGTQPWGEPISVPCDCAAPPAPVSVPAAMEMDDDFDSAFEHGKAVGWNAYRAAMLQSFGNSEQLNSPVIQDGWVACVERMPSAGEQVLAYRPDAPESNVH
ncbi:ead/Ea22-like family protein [Enterobacter hormaechei]|uniref:ead/Ea22-like family protein n=1 Tax=Enterobacter hormaechei TaxID=158836 RepID=UPI003B9D8A62